MKRTAIIILVLTLLITLIPGCRSPYQANTYTDDMGRTVTFERAPERIVSHVPAITEMLYALGLGDKVVGVSDYDNYPPEVKEKPSVGNYYNPAIENIVALNPDLVVTDGHSDTIQQLDNLNIPYIVIDPQNIDGIKKDIELLGEVAGVEDKANQLVESMDRQINDVTTKIKGLPKLKVFYVIDIQSDPNNPWTAGPGSMIDWLITTAGGNNIASNATGAYIQFSLEEVVSAAPDIIIYPEYHGSESITVDTFRNHPIWSQMTAVKQGKLYSIDDDLVSRNGPRITQGLLEIAKIIHPEAFK